MNKIYQKIAHLQAARLSCIELENTKWLEKHTDNVSDIMLKFGPSGSGLDSGTMFDYEKSTDEKLVFNSSYHVMNSEGYYSHWIYFIVTVLPSFYYDISISIKGNFGIDQDIKDIVCDRFYEFLISEID